MLIFRTSDCTTKDFQAPASPSRPKAPFRQAGGFAPMSPWIRPCNFHPFILNRLCFVQFRHLIPSPTHRFQDMTELLITIYLHSPSHNKLGK